MFDLKVGTQARKDFKKLKKSSLADFNITKEFVELLLVDGYKGIDTKYKAHKLIGNYKDCYECHIKSDLLLIWQEYENGVNILQIIRVGSHSELFKK